MQHEKLYSLRDTGYYICALFMLRQTPNPISLFFVTAKMSDFKFLLHFETINTLIKISFCL